MEKAFGGPENAPPQANTPAAQQRPATPRTPKHQLLRAPTGRTPRRSPRIAKMSPRMDDVSLMDAFSETYPSIFENFEDLVSSASPMFMEGLLNVGDNDFASQNYFASMSPVMSHLMSGDALMNHPFAGSSPGLARRILSPGDSHRRMPFGSQRGSPHLHLAATGSSPYCLRSLTSPGRTGMTPKTYFADLPDAMYHKPTTSSTVKRDLSDAMFAPVKRPATPVEDSKSKKVKKEKKPPRKTATASKRGEYRCGKCGFFPKKSKHNCQLEKAKRQADAQQQQATGHATRAPTGAVAASAAPNMEPLMGMFPTSA
eukprot:m.290870 g.290870  ORF g.290870 m.290870 type:complete len:314 (+) comp12373_c0_seq1:145-1086(+)